MRIASAGERGEALAKVRHGLTARVVIASGVLAAIVGTVFVILLLAINRQRDAAALSRHSQQVLVAASDLERFVIDLETGERGFTLTHEATFLQPWTAAVRAIPAASRRLNRLAVVRDQDARARRITDAVASYVRDYSVPTVDAARRDDSSAGSVAVIADGKRRVDVLRAQFQGLVAAEKKLAATRHQRADDAARQAIIAASVGLVVWLLLIILYVVYLTRAIVRPVRRAATMAGQLARGDLSVRMPESGTAEIGALERSFNTMGSSLEASRGELRRLADEQAALRRVATLVARGGPPEATFRATQTEVRALLEADSAGLIRYDEDGGATVVAVEGNGAETPVGTRLTLEGESVAAVVSRAGSATRIDTHEEATAGDAALPGERPIRTSVGAPIVVEGHLWGLMTADWSHDDPPPPETESRMAQFTELLATAIANAEARAELAASRARVVAAADETRRRIERDLHDGAQQRLVSLALELRAAETGVPSELAELRAQFAQTARGLNDVVTDLQEISRGIHPAILSKGGLGPALKTLTRRSAVPVELDLHVANRRMPERVEVAAYYVVSEALTNTAKHARASVVNIDVTAGDALLELSIRDDGIGGADASLGSGLIGLRDRVESLGGTIEIAGRPGDGTSILAKIPIDK